MPPHGTSPDLAPPSDTPSRLYLGPAPAADKTARVPWVPATFRALRHRNYRLYFLGQLISLLGTLAQGAALTWLAFQLTHASRWPALISAAQVAPAFFLGPLGGALAERWCKRSLIFWTQAAYLVLAFALAALVLSGVAQPWHLLVIALGNGLVNALDLPARLAFVMDMVGPEDLGNAVALNSLLFNVARAVGPAVGGPLLLYLGAGPCFLLNGLSYFAVLAALAAMDVALLRPTPAGARKHGTLRGILGGFGYLRRRPWLAGLILLSGVMTFFGWAFMVLLPALAERQMGIHEGGYCLMLSATGVGALLAAFVVASLDRRERRPLFLVAGAWLSVVALFGLAQAHSLGGGLFWCALLGFGLILFFPTCQAVVQLGSSDTNRGRIMGIWVLVQAATQPVGNLASGVLADAWHVEGALA
ncbi:MAG TPA: MFS transporter, partial [Gemmataceae bacterium]|nr:MFS transporter [Gemmataceae bacterium]